MKKMWMWCLAATFGLRVNFACSDSNKEEEKPSVKETLTVTTTAEEATVDYLGGELTLAYTTNVEAADLKVTSSEDWVSVGTPGESSVVLTVAEYEEETARTATITFASQKTSKLETFVITQTGIIIIPVEEIYEVDTEEISVDAAGGDISFVTKTNVEFSVESQEDWIKLVTDGRDVQEYTAKLTVEANKATEERSGKITVTFTTSNDDNVRTVTVKQEAAEPEPEPEPETEVLEVKVSMIVSASSIKVSVPEELAEKLGTDDLLSDLYMTDENPDGTITYAGVNADGSEYESDEHPEFTTNGPIGHWYNTDEDVIVWGTPDPNETGAERLAYLEGDGVDFNLGLGKEFKVGDTFTLRGVYTNGKTKVEVDYIVTMEAAPEFKAPDPDYTYEKELTLNNTWATVDWELEDADEIAEILGVDDLSTAILEGDVIIRGYNVDGTMTEDVFEDCTGNSGYWFDADGAVTTYGPGTMCAEFPSGTYVDGTMCMMYGNVEEDGYYPGYYAYCSYDGDAVVVVKLVMHVIPMEVDDTEYEIVDTIDVDFEFSYENGYEGGTVSIEEHAVDIADMLELSDISEATVVFLYSDGSVSPDSGSGRGETDGWFGEDGPAWWGNGSIAYMQLNTGNKYEFESGVHPEIASPGDTAKAYFQYRNKENGKAVNVNVTVEVVD